MSTFFGIQMAGRQGNLLLLRKIFPYSDLGIVLIGDNIGFYIVSLVGQVIFKDGLLCRTGCQAVSPD